MAECFKFFDLKSRIMTSFDTLSLDVNFGHLLTGSNFSNRPRGCGGDGNDDGNNGRDNGGGGTRGPPPTIDGSQRIGMRSGLPSR